MQQLKKEHQTQWNTRLTTGAAIASTIAAFIAIWVSVSSNSNLDTTNAQVEALTKRVQTLEAQLQQRQHPQREDAYHKPSHGTSLPAR
jgi:polyhydroxyalkanoate synthesis regulator phasin